VNHVWAYQVETSDDLSVVSAGDEIDFHPLDMYMMDDGAEFVILRHRPYYKGMDDAQHLM